MHAEAEVSHGPKKRNKKEKRRSKGPDGVMVTDEESEVSNGDYETAKVEKADENTKLKPEADIQQTGSQLDASGTKEDKSFLPNIYS